MRFEVGENEAGRRLDRVLKKILRDAPLSFVYRTIRKDVKVNGRRAEAETLLGIGDAVEIFLPDEALETVRGKERGGGAVRRQFGIIYEDEQILVVNKPFGLLTHGDGIEKKNTLANQVVSWLANAGKYEPGAAKAFTPAPANRLDRNTTGIVLFGKTLPATQALAKLMRGEDGDAGASGRYVEKRYLTVVRGVMKEPLTLRAKMARDGERNVTRVLPVSAEGKAMALEARPLAAGGGFTLVEVALLTGRTHQIRAQLAGAGYPVLGDRKYGDGAANRLMQERYGLEAQLLHAYRLTVVDGAGCLDYLTGKTFRAEPPGRFAGIAEDLGCYMKTK